MLIVRVVFPDSHFKDHETAYIIETYACIYIVSVVNSNLHQFSCNNQLIHLNRTY